MILPTVEREGELAALVRAELIAQYRKLMMRGLYAMPPTLPFVYWVLRRDSSRHRIVVWLTLVLVSFALSSSITVFHQRIAKDSLKLFAVPATLVGLVWGLLPFIVDPTNPVAQMVLIVIMVAVCAVGTGVNAPSPFGFTCMLLSLMVPGSLYLAMADEPRLRTLWPFTAVLFTLMTGIHRAAHQGMIDATEAKVTNDLLLEELQSERRKIEASHVALMSANRKLNHRATHDPLTGLINRAALVERLDSLVAKSRPGAGVAVMYLDLDRFKLVNDSLGHHVGDELLMAAAQRCRDLLPNHSIARLGGDEFCVLMYPVASITEVEVAANRLRVALEQPVNVSGRTITVPASIGISVGFGDTTPNDLQRFADVALYQAKDGGRNRVASFDRLMRDSMEELVDQGADLRDALNNKLIVPWFQPEIKLATGEMIGAEALARWITPKQVFTAGLFMPIAEQVGLDELISDQMMGAALKARHRWHHRDGVDPAFRLRINVTAQQLTSESHVDSFLNSLNEHQIPPCGVSIEITETSVIRDLALASASLKRVRATGVTVALDDFGTGHSSLSLLRELPLDGVKIDRSFVSNLVNEQRDRALVKSVVDLALGLGLTVTAEGVETNQQADILRDVGCNSAQGFLYSPAIPNDELLKRLGRPAGQRRAVAMANIKN